MSVAVGGGHCSQSQVTTTVAEKSCVDRNSCPAGGKHGHHQLLHVVRTAQWVLDRSCITQYYATDCVTKLLFVIKESKLLASWTLTPLCMKDEKYIFFRSIPCRSIQQPLGPAMMRLPTIIIATALCVCMKMCQMSLFVFTCMMCKCVGHDIPTCARQPVHKYLQILFRCFLPQKNRTFVW